jgi:hypothetical protein
VVVVLACRALSANTILVFNPWDGQSPAQVPVAYVNGLSTGVTMTPSSQCGWYQLAVPSMPSGILVKSSGTATVWGSGGMGSGSPINLAAYNKYDTVWISSVSGGSPTVKTGNPGTIGTCATDTSGYALVSGGRCDLQTDSLMGSTGCLDLGSLNGTTLKVPSSITRISPEGLVLCGSGGVGVPGTDIAYIVDQSGSMVAFHTSNLILPHGSDTINFHDCKDWTSPTGVKYPGTLPMVTYKGYSVQELPTSTYDSAIVHCTPSGDPYQQRAIVVQEAIAEQARLAPTSEAAWISFGTNYTSTKLYGLGDTASADSLAGQVSLQNLNTTNYADPIGWARALLQGATSGTQTMPPSPNSRKAIILVSDGAPNDYGAAQAELLAGAKVTSPTGTTWTLPNKASPPIYGIMLSPDTTQGKDLKNLAIATGGAYYWIPTLDKDSLNHVMERLLGLLVQKSTPDSLSIQNLTNGEVSTSVASGQEGGGYRFRLDSLVGLNAGNNVLELRDVLHNGSGDSVVTAKWTIDVTDSATTYSPTGADSLLMAACYAPTVLRLRPATDTTRTFADQRDNSVRMLLDVRPEGIFAFPVPFSTSVSLDSGKDVLKMTPDTTTILAELGTTNSWVLSQGPPIRTDAIVQTGYGWDTLRGVFHMPRDYRDSAIAYLPLFHPAPVGIKLSPDTASGDSGRFQVAVTDPNIATDTTSAEIHHRLGDSLRVILHRGPAGVFAGSFAFLQNAPVVQGDTVLQLGPARTRPLDSVWAVYQAARDTALVERISPELDFVDAQGRILDSIPFRSMELGQADTIRVGLFVNGQLLAQTDSVGLASSPWLSPLGSSGPISGLRLSGGLGTVVVQGTRPGTGGSVVLRLSGSPDSLVRHLDVTGFYLRFVGADGAASDSFSADTVVRGRVQVGLRLWSMTGPVSRQALILAKPVGGNIVFTDGAGKVDSLFPLVDGMATLWMRSDVPVHSIGASFTPDSLWAAVQAAPLSWHAPAPDSAVYLDSDGDGALDQARVSFAVPWNPANQLTLHWPDGSTILDLTKATRSVSPDSLTVAWNFAVGQSPLATGWTGAAQPGSFSWDSTDPVQAFAVQERIAPVPLRARLGLGSAFDTLDVWVSEPLNAADGAQWLRWGRPSLGMGGDSIARIHQALISPLELELLVDTSFPAAPGDSVRLAVWPEGGISDTLGNGPALLARWVPLEFGPAPFRFALSSWPAMATSTGWTIPAGESPMTLLVRTQPGGPWLSPSGQAVTVDSSHFAGVLIKTTRDLEGGAVYLYDNSGVSVASVDLGPVLQSLRQGAIATSLRGEVQIWAAWDGRSDNGEPVASGVYLARALGWTTVHGQRAVVNRIYHLGWRVPGK